MFSAISVKKSGNGVSIIELIIGIVILAFMLISTFTIFSSEMGSIGRTRDFSAAVLVAQETIEAIRNFPFEKISKEDAGNESIEACINGDTASPEYPHKVQAGRITFERNVKIKNVPGAGGLTMQLRAIELEIKWQSEDKRDLSYKLATCVTKIN